MKYANLYLYLSASLILGACSSSKRPYVPGQRVINTPVPLVSVNHKLASRNFRLLYGNNPTLEKAFNSYLAKGRAADIYSKGFVKLAYTDSEQHLVNLQPFIETVIQLQPGEKYTSITSGSPNQLTYMPAVSGSASGQDTINILVKPRANHFSTNLVITTDRRVYNLKIVVGAEGRLTNNISFWYPQDMVEQINEKIQKVNDNDLKDESPNLDLAKANFDYKINSDDDPSWMPTRVFDDGIRTWIQFPKGIGSKNTPAISVKNKHGKPEMYNYSVKSPYMIVEGIFDEAELMLGVGGDQEIVTIKRK